MTTDPSRPDVADALRRAAAERPWMCLTHPDVTLDGSGECAECAREVDAAIQRAELAHVQSEFDRRVPQRYRHAHADHSDVITWAQQFATDPDASPSLLLMGPTGVGKTHQAYGALRVALEGAPRTPWLATTTADMLADLRPHPGVDSEAVMRRYRNVPLLMVDDLGMAKQSEWVEEAMYRVIDGRYVQMRPSVFTTNLPMADLRTALGDRIASRLSETCTPVILPGPDRRRQR